MLSRARDGEDDGVFSRERVSNYLTFVGGAMRRRVRLLSAVFAATMALVVTALLMLPKTYHAEVKLTAQRNPVLAVRGDGPDAPVAPTKGAIETVHRRDNLVAIVASTHLVQHFKEHRAPSQRAMAALRGKLSRTKPTEQDEIDGMVDMLEKRLVAWTNEGTVTIAVDWQDPWMANEIIEAAQRNYLAARYTMEISALSESIAIVAGHSAGLKADIDKAVAAVDTLRGKKASPDHAAGAVEAAAVPGPMAVKPKKVDAAPAVEPEDAPEKRAAIAQKQRMIDELEDSRRKRLSDAQARLSEQQSVYTENHPVIVNLRTTIGALSAPSPEVALLRSELAALRAPVARVPAQDATDAPAPATASEPAGRPLPALPVRSAVIVPKIENGVLRLDAELAEERDPAIVFARRQLRDAMDKYAFLQNQVQAAEIELETAQAAFKYRYNVLTPTQMPKHPIKPNMPLMLFVAMIAALVTAIVAAVVADMRSGRVVERWQLEALLGQPILGEMALSPAQTPLALPEKTLATFRPRAPTPEPHPKPVRGDTPMHQDRRHFPRLEAHVLWRAPRLGGPQSPVLDVSEGGLRVYSDDMVAVGSRLEMELLFPGEETLEVLARVVRVDTLPKGSPAKFDVAVEFLDVPVEAREKLISQGAISGEHARVGPPSEPRKNVEKADEVEQIEQKDARDGLLEPSLRAGVTGGPERNDDVREEDRNEEGLLHASRRSGARATRTRNGGRLSVLFVTPYLPSPSWFGGQTRLQGLISGIARANDVSVLSLVDPSEDHAASVKATEAYARSVITVQNHRYAAGNVAKRLIQLASILSPDSYERMVHLDAAFETELDRLTATERFDVIHFSFPHMAAYRTRRVGVPNAGPAYLLDEHNIEHDLVRQTAVSGETAIRRAFSAINRRKVHAEEKSAWARLDGCTVTSEHDQELLLADSPTTRTAVVPNGVDLAYYVPRPAPELAGAKPTLLFFGAIDYYPNTDGVLYYLRQVKPHLDRLAPGTKLEIVGRRPPDEILAAASEDVAIRGPVADLRPHIAAASVVIVPLRIGGGTRLKILEAMAMGKAVVSTSLGAEGLDAVPERDLLIADDAETFAKQVKRVLDDPALAARLGAAARELVSARYGWERSVERLSSFYHEVLESRGVSLSA